MISGGGSNLQSLIDTIERGTLDARIDVVVSNNPGVGGLERAKNAGIPTEVLDHRKFGDRDSYDRALRQLLERYDPQLIVLAGFMRILGERFVRRFQGRILNIHPSLLPKFAGLDTHRRALEARESEHGCTVHFVTPTLDGGPPVIQGAVRVCEEDTPAALAARVLEVEHRIYPLAVSMIASGRLQYVEERPWLDGKELTEPVQFAPN